MPYHLVTLPFDDDEPWAAQLMAELERQESEGFGLLAMVTRPVAQARTAGIGGATRYGTQLVLVLYREGEA